jgi:hypothetical protein
LHVLFVGKKDIGTEASVVLWCLDQAYQQRRKRLWTRTTEPVTDRSGRSKIETVRFPVNSAPHDHEAVQMLLPWAVTPVVARLEPCWSPWNSGDFRARDQSERAFQLEMSFLCCPSGNTVLSIRIQKHPTAAHTH